MDLQAFKSELTSIQKEAMPPILLRSRMRLAGDPNAPIMRIEDIPKVPKQVPTLPMLQKQGMDPMTAAGLAVTGKLALFNALQRHGMKIPLVKDLMAAGARRAIGFGARAGAAGQPMISRPIREIVAILGDPSAVKLYEAGYQAGAKLGPVGLLRTRAAARGLSEELAFRAPELAKAFKAHTDVIGGVSLKPQAADVLHMPVGEAIEAAGTRLKAMLPKTNTQKVLDAAKRLEQESAPSMLPKQRAEELFTGAKEPSLSFILDVAKIRG